MESTQKQNEAVFKQTIWKILSKTIEVSGCQSNAIRLQKNGDFPFYVHKGYPDFFIVKENSLLLGEKNKEGVYVQECGKILECMCGNVINSHFNSSFPFFSNKGSFWTNSSTNLLDTITEEQRKFIGYTRNLCNYSGYESVALIPLKIDGNTLGLVHLADPRENMFTVEKISELEMLADEFASIIKRAYEITEIFSKINKMIS
ncbi:MAG: GAF domain-containing protein [Candidatus Ranarchaeia archaeon]|jgi:hypothetical protein